MARRINLLQLAVLAVLLVLVGGCAGRPAVGTTAQTSPARVASATSSRPAQSEIITRSVSAPTPEILKAVASPTTAPARSTATTGSAARVARPIDANATVRGTNGAGLWLRDDPDGNPVKVWPEGSPMAVLGEARAAGGLSWLPVQTVDGRVGWAAADYLDMTDTRSAAVAPTPSTTARLAAPARASQVAPTLTPRQRPSAPAPTATAAATNVPTTPVPLPPVSQLDPRLVPAYRALVELPKIGQSNAEIVKQSGVRLAVGDTPGAWGSFNASTNVVTIDTRTVQEDPRAVAAVLAHEIAHAAQAARSGRLLKGQEEQCVARELEAHKVGLDVWKSYWPGESPPARTRLERELAQMLMLHQREGDAGMQAHLRGAYKGQCAG